MYMKENESIQNPSKVVITPKPPKKGKANTTPSPELKDVELKVEKLEGQKAAKDTVSVKTSVKSK